MAFARLLALSAFCAFASAQTTTQLPPPPTYPDGVFTNPDTSKAQIFTKGSSMNVSWTTTYDRVTLWLIYDGEFNDPYQIASGSAQPWVLWTVDDHGNNSRPFNFRAVNTDGTDEQQRSGGFYTGQFWIYDGPDPASSSTIATTTTLAPSSLSQSLTALASATSAQPANTNSATPTGSSGGSSSDVDIGVGVGVGVGVGIILVALGAWFLIRRRKKRNQPAAPEMAQSGPGNTHAPPGYGYVGQEWANGSDMTKAHQSQYGMASPQPSELNGGLQSPVEAPGHQVEPRELPADTSGAQFARSSAA